MTQSADFTVQQPMQSHCNDASIFGAKNSDDTLLIGLACACPKLTNLQLSSSGRSGITRTGLDALFTACTDLQVLSLQISVKIQQMPASFFGLTSLRDVSLSFGLCEFPDRFGKLKSLEVLTLECLHITDLPDSIGQLTALTELSISNCQRLQDLPDSIGDLRSLKKLETFRAKPLEVLPDSIGQLRNLENVLLYLNRSLCELPDSFFQLPSLKVFKLWELKHLPELESAVSSLVALEMLHIEKCWFESLPDSLCQLPNLRRLMVTDCWDLTSLPRSIGDASSLQRLKFSNLGSLECLPGSISKLSDLQSFVLKRCGAIMEFPASLFQDCTSLKKLEFDWPYSCGNDSRAGSVSSAEFVSNLCELSSLTSLVLSGVPDLTTLPPQIVNLSELEQLKLHSWPKLACLPDSMSKLVDLYYLEIVTCPTFDKTIKKISGLPRVEIVRESSREEWASDDEWGSDDEGLL
ncbi:unnamed protein product [Closterium sp. Yama58-4]|nr:unnamed protein product [Closterium sp. Yama58-4]